MSNNTTTMAFCNRGRLRKLASGGPAHRVRKGLNLGNVIELPRHWETGSFWGEGPTIARVVNVPAILSRSLRKVDRSLFLLRFMTQVSGHDFSHAIRCLKKISLRCRPGPRRARFGSTGWRSVRSCSQEGRFWLSGRDAAKRAKKSAAISFTQKRSAANENGW
jgi:hypothetical protein